MWGPRDRPLKPGVWQNTDQSSNPCHLVEAYLSPLCPSYLEHSCLKALRTAYLAAPPVPTHVFGVETAEGTSSIVETNYLSFIPPSNLYSRVM